ncbi:hypothetical protein COL87_09540 [Bacillus pseudomycoides]|nr:hypothetical protein CON94_16300 [Bacillus pseudomycoides]PEI31626.1 hypothetical protein CN641_30870 [Bacillus pseudomycoides]PEL76163.1 hypothetical protein CN615_27715 [Bacillus pseudomycoides]PGA72553.1 hypothetical protein COL87_09540 [Bacillus pseudomycoides]PGE96384.1 hypothetical protein COM62_15145 [Bacillus pseudomycoides]
MCFNGYTLLYVFKQYMSRSFFFMGAPHHHQVNKNPPDAESIWRLCGSHLASHIYIFLDD